MSEDTGVSLDIASGEEDIAHVRALFGEYAQSLGFSLCFQGFDQELASLPGGYGPPRGRLLLARVGGRVAGCVALRPLDGPACEMKRLYVRPKFRGMKLGRRLAEAIIDAARDLGYTRMRLDTLARLHEACALYEALGFVEIPAYNHTPLADVRHFERVVC
ncbi:MAG TPA: GNAT family N-acetyltransferase [Azospirillaceae bacterium]|nr:GNAT family N-acetyltransferase [Azospirillaceae bacterium]